MADSFVQIKIENLRFQYAQSSPFALQLDSVRQSLVAPLGIYGLSGSGKTTLGKLLGGILSPDAGEITLRPQQPGRLYINQFPERNFLGVAVAETLALIRQGNPGQSELQERVEQILDQFGIAYSAIRHKNGFEMSGGELRRFALALGFAFRPEFLILDEPTIGMGNAGCVELGKIARAFGETHSLIVISHDIRLLENITNHLWILKRGRLIFGGLFAQLAAEPEILEQVGLADEYRKG